MRIGVVGAGIAGLGAARQLKKGGVEVVLFEQSGDVGGRCSTRIIDEFTFDTGATSIAPRGKLLESLMLQDLDTSDLVKISKPIYQHSSLRISPGDAARAQIARYTYSKGNAVLPHLLSAGLEVRRGTHVESIVSSNSHFEVLGERFDALVLAGPIPEMIPLIESTGQQRPVSHVHYRSCIAVLLGFDKEMPPINYHAIIEPEQRHPLTWLSIESEKSPGRAPDGQTAMVAQLSPQFSSMHYEDDDGAIVAATVEYIERLYGSAWSSPVAFDVKRWKHSQPESLALFDSVNQPGSRLVLASDGLIGGRIEYAYEAGARAAMLLGALK